MRYMYSFTNSMALKYAVELRIADLIHSNGGAATFSQIASCINDSFTSPNITTLARIMRLFVCRKIFTIHPPSDGGDFLYDLTNSSRWLLHDLEQTLAHGTNGEPSMANSSLALLQPMRERRWNCLQESLWV
ncbi:hypothetical protein Golax_025966 [Gossypium laxum]|uniref:O-methyltransferase dimerisation domain-containing protein n=1 Tax=Gossypium laxum TaxID=34288 RepID=A0A7J9B0U7_9ROSI|nr:hypothetical protein [Gossypium laxum]